MQKTVSTVKKPYVTVLRTAEIVKRALLISGLNFKAG
jgi:hypothetical protein